MRRTDDRLELALRPVGAVAPVHLRYGMALLASALAVVIRVVVGPVLGDAVPTTLFIIPVVLAAWYGGLGPGLLATSLSGLAATYSFIYPTQNLRIADPADLVRLGAYLAVGILVSLLSQTLHSAILRARASAAETSRLAGELESQASELTRRMGEAHEARERAERSERVLRMQGRVLDCMYEGVSVADESGVIVYTNPAEDRMFGYAPGELLGQNLQLLNASPSNERGRTFDAVIEELRAVGEWSGQCENVRKDGTRFVTQAHITALEYDGRKHWVCVQADATERIRAAARKEFLAEASHILTASLADDGTLSRLARHCVPFLADYASLDLLMDDGEIVYRVATAHRDPAKETIVRTLWSRYPYKVHENVGVPEVIRSGEPQFLPEFTDDAVVAFARDEEHLSLMRQLAPRSFMAVPLTERGRTYGAISLVFSDSGRRYTSDDLDVARELAVRAAGAIDNARLFRQAEDAAERLRTQVVETERAREDAQEANQAKGQFLATMSHELRTPLNAIGGYVDLLEMEIHGPVTGAQAEALRRVKRSAEHLLGLINDILNFARVEAGHLTFDFRAIPVAPMLANLEPLVAPQLTAKALQYICEPGAPDVAAYSDVEKLRQILLNLLSNAINFTPEGGRIVVSSDADPGSIEIRVRDTGIGIPQEKVESIFAPFVQVRRGLTTTHEGTGLGLAISRDLARAMEGDLTVISVEGQGSTFTLRIPRAHPPDRAVSPARASALETPRAG